MGRGWTTHVALVGFMAAGKTTVGKHLARELDIPFVDTDDLIVTRHGPISDLFARAGEPGFRVAEYEAVCAALAGRPSVVALGGGALTYPATRAVLQGRALRVYLNLSVETLVARLRRSRTVRPVMGPEPTHERVATLLAAREPAYLEAEIVVPGPRATKRAFAQEIARRVRAHEGERGDECNSRLAANSEL